MVFHLIALITLCLGALFLIIVRALWKYLYRVIPKFGKEKIWPLFFMSTIHALVIIAGFVIMVMYFVVNSSTSSENQQNVQKMVKELNAHAESSNAILGNVQNIPSSSSSEGPKVLKDFLKDVKENSGLDGFQVSTRNINNDYSQFLSSIINGNECDTSDSNLDYSKMNCQMEGVVFCAGNITATANKINDKYIDMQPALRTVTNNHNDELVEETKRITSYLTSTTVMLKNIASSFTESSKLVEQNTNAVGNMSDFIPICLSSIFALIFAALCIFAHIKYRNLALPSRFSYVLMAGFYILLVEVLILSSYQIYLGLTSSDVCPDKPADLLSFTTESYKNNNETVNVNDILVDCSSAKKKFFSTHESPISVAESVFIRNYRDQFLEKTIEAFDHNGAFENLSKIIQDAQELSAIMLKLINKCTGTMQTDIATYRDVLVETETYLKESQQFGDKLKNIKNIATNAIDKALEPTKLVVSKPINEINRALTESDFDCRQTVETFSNGLNPCKLADLSFNFRLKFTILLCSIVCAFGYLMALRRTDLAQYGNDTRRKWALSQIAKVEELNSMAQSHEFAAKLKSEEPPKAQFAMFEKYKNVGNIRRDNRKCWDRTRVVLKNRDSDFIYASWVEIPNCQRKYIVTQEPLENTTSEFWAMCCQENVNTILMIAENEREEVPTYFPTNIQGTKIVGTLHITCTEIKPNPFEDVNWRILKVQDTGKMNSAPKYINHIHALWWSEGVIPNDPKQISDLYCFVNNLNKANSLICVHSEHGHGRAASYVFFDYAYSQICKNEKNDMHQYIKELRQMKYDAVESSAQLQYVISGLIELIVQEGVVDSKEAMKYLLAYESEYRSFFGR